MDLNQIAEETKAVLTQYFEQVTFPKNGLFVLGCTSSEVAGYKIGGYSNQAIGDAIINTILPILREKGIQLAVQGCQHINRALLVEREVAEQRGYEIVTVYPSLHAGGAAQIAAYHAFQDPVEVEHIVADGGLDIGDTEIGMHVKFVQIPIRTAQKDIGLARATMLTSRPRLIGGARAVYDETLIK
ncbi:TIGR01440 family protein [Secundilactobacillus oryzae]|uniref:TIGR01440 family protein n=1 Tax=Secundilactobacillus oryzae TaxID=1202668 RepID=UPI003F76CEDB